MSLDAEFAAANAAQQAGRYDEAEARYRALVPAKPLWAHHNLAVLYVRTHRFAEAETEFRAALAAEPGAPLATFGYSLLLLSQGRYAEGWPLYEARRKTGDANIPQPQLPYPEWRGEDLAGKHLVVVAEQGLGDQLQFARFLPLLRARCAQVTFISSPALAPVFSDLGVRLLPPDKAPARADAWVLMGSLPLWLDLRLENLPPPARLARPPAIRRGGIGVMARGRPTHANDRFRSLDAAAAERLLALGRDLAPEATGARDFADTAQIVEGLDLVITVDTSVAHLAASLGKPTWILVPARDTDWRWLQDRTDSPWYPSARLYRQSLTDTWAAVLDRVEADLGRASRLAQP